MSELPISCIRCRRRKIKCNKRKPCNQCIKHNVPCQFPAKFRNISYDGSKDAVKIESSTSESNEHSSSASPSDVSKLEDQVRRLQAENQYIREQYERKLQEHARERERDNEPEHLATGAFKISGETTEKGEKYYGPLLSNNMTEDFDKISNSNRKMKSTADLQHHSWTSDPFKIAESENDSDTTSEEDLLRNSETFPLPWVVGEKQSREQNLGALKALVRDFFTTKTYDYFISESKVLEFIDEYSENPDTAWECGDDLLLLHMLLILSLQRLSPTTYNEMILPPVANFQYLWKTVKPVQKRLFRGFSRLRHNLLNESYVTVQAYILCTEWEFIEQRYEESWSMMFHCCSIAYALGLHVVTRSSSLSFESLINSTSQNGGEDGEEKSKDGYDDYYTDELPKLRVWFALRNLNSQMCSILGRPNPIMLQVNHVSLPMTSISNVEDARALNNLTNSQLKLGVSECIRLSNSNMIESFLKKITMEEVWTINGQFSEEIDKLSYYLSSQYENLINGVVKTIDSLTDMPTTITRKDVLIDLVVLHVNRVKLLEPFVDMLPPNKDALNFIMGSILLFYEHTCELVSEFVKSEIPRILQSDEAKEGEIRLDKVFVYRDPFFASFIYQGIVVTFILISLKAKDFIQENNGDFITQVEGQLHMLLGLHTSILKLVEENIHLWSRSNIFLMKKILEHIGIMKQAFNGQVNAPFNGFEYDPQIAEMLGTNLRDPFWVANPENSTNFLGIPEDLDDNAMSGNSNGTNLMMNNPQAGKLRVSGYSQYENPVAAQMMQNPQQHQQQQQQQQANEMSLFVQDPMGTNIPQPYTHMLSQAGYDDNIDIDGDGTGNLGLGNHNGNLQ